MVVEPGEGVISIEEEDSRSLLSGEGVLIVSVNMDASGGTSTGAVRGEEAALGVTRRLVDEGSNERMRRIQEWSRYSG